MRSLLACLVFVAACGARASTPPPPPRTTPPPDTTPNPSRPSEAECETLFAHALDIAVAERQPPPTDADRATLQAELRPSFVADCRGGSRHYYQCGLAAKTRAELEACKSANAE